MGNFQRDYIAPINEDDREYVLENFDRALREGWIQVYNQPIVRAANGMVSDEEALARWCDPVIGVMDAECFIRVLEEAGLIHKLDLYIVDNLLAKMKKQAEEGLYVVSESINLSREDFDACDIVEEIRSRVDNAGIGRDKLIIEIKESIIGNDFRFMKEQIERFQALGFKVWMDDFGIGFSAMEVLEDLHYDAVKLNMKFMQSLKDSESCKIILVGVIRMVSGLGIDIIAEGVENHEQAEFLIEVGCTKLQGYFYSRPLLLEGIIELSRKGELIGFENPLESDYYTSIGKVNLYDMSISKDDDETLQDYFDTMPMAILETGETSIRMARCNKTYREFLEKTLPPAFCNKEVDYSMLSSGPGSGFLKALRQCGIDGKRVVMDEKTTSGKVVHVFIRRIAINPVTGVIAFAVVVLGIIDDTMPNAGPTYAYVARALSSDYINLYYVNLDNDTFIEYSADNDYEDLAVERHGENFFEASRRDAKTQIYEEDLDAFLRSFTKQNIIENLDEHGSFTITYRIKRKNGPVYVNMKVVRIKTRGNHIIIGLNNVDAQMKEREVLERANEERKIYERITALNGDYICIYTVDPRTDHFTEYSATGEYKTLGINEEGEDFFKSTVTDAKKVVYLEDLDAFLSSFSKEKVLNQIEKNGVFAMNYRIVLGEEPVYISLKAAMIEEIGGPQLIVGLINIDEQVKRDQEYIYNLSLARNEANIDVLTGVKNKHAYVDVEAQLNSMIAEEEAPEFALAVLDLNGLKAVNDTLGHQAGDEFIKRGCAIICSIFRHSPVFRVGGDEFAVICQGRDYKNIDLLMSRLEETNTKNLTSGNVVIAGGMARYQGERRVASVFERADVAMYENKKYLKTLHT